MENRDLASESKILESYGVGDSSYRAAGQLEGITALVDEFYHQMDTLPEARIIRAMHPADLTLSRQKLAYFLAGWLGGPKLYGETFGPIHIPKAHQHLPVDEAGRDAWLQCMRLAVAKQPYAADFKEYLLRQLWIPAERIRILSEQCRQAQQ